MEDSETFTVHAGNLKISIQNIFMGYRSHENLKPLQIQVKSNEKREGLGSEMNAHVKDREAQKQRLIDRSYKTISSIN